MFYLTIEENNCLLDLGLMIEEKSVVLLDLDLGLIIEENGVDLLDLGLMIEEKWRKGLAEGFKSSADPGFEPPPLLGSVDLLLQKVPLLGPASSMPSTNSANESSGFLAR